MIDFIMTSVSLTEIMRNYRDYESSLAKSHLRSEWLQLLMSVCCTKQLSWDTGAVKGGNWFTWIFTPSHHFQGLSALQILLWIILSQHFYVLANRFCMCPEVFSGEPSLSRSVSRADTSAIWTAKVISLWYSSSQVSKLLGWGVTVLGWTVMSSSPK